MNASERKSGRITALLERAPGPVFVAYAILAAFTTYFCMYAFRKPFAAAKFEGQFFFGSAVELKTAIVISQIIGYTLSKYIGIKFCSEITPGRRAWALLVLIGWAELALVGFGLAPDNWKVIAIFLNGLPLGMVWGLVVWYLEGRRTSELLLAGLSCSYIVSSGIVKDVGRAMMAGTVAEGWSRLPLVGAYIGAALGKVSESWMPAATGLHFLPIFLLAVWALNQIPRPNQSDVAARGGRKPMDSSDRLAFLRQFLFGLVLLCISYCFLTAYRDFRDNYQVELFDGLGYPYAQNRTIISKTETMVMFGVIAAMALLNLIKDNRRGFIGTYIVMAGGIALLGISTLLLDVNVISGFWWMALVGLGSYLAYVPYGAVLFERLMASTRFTGTAVFAIYLADSVGYTGSVAVQLYRDLAQHNVSRLAFFKGFTYFMAIVGTNCLVSSCIYFLRRQARASTGMSPVHPPAEVQA